jgi:sugar/nucleoside kinase (ribokinase family)
MPHKGGYVEIESEQFMLGGEAANTANALRTWGAEVVLAGNGAGDDSRGDRLRKLISDQNLEIYGSASQGDAQTPVCDVYVSGDGERTMIGAGFSAMRPAIPVQDLPFVRGSWFTAEPNMAVASREAALAAERAGMRLYLMDFLNDDDPINAGSFWQCSTDWAGTRNNLQRNVAYVQRLVQRKGCFGILSDGPNGFVAGSPELPVRAYPPYPAAQVVDATGAGDMFRAGMLFGLDQDWPISRCLQFASAAGSLKVGYLGATSRVPSVSEILALVEANPQISRLY